MSKRLLLAALLFSGLYGWTQAPQGGIIFFKGTLEELFAEATRQNRLVFVDAYAEWCGPCKRMDKDVFPVPEVGAFYNTHFINYKLDMEKGEGPEFARQLGVRVYPTFLWLNASGEMVHRAVGGRSPEGFIALGQTAIDPGKQIIGMRKAYEAGQRDPEFVIRYATALSDAYLDYQSIIGAYFQSATPEDKNGFHWKNAVMVFAQPGSAEFDALLQNRGDFTPVFGVDKVFTKIYNAFNTQVSRTLREKRTMTYEAVTDSVFLPFSFPDKEMFRLHTLASYYLNQRNIAAYEQTAMQLLDTWSLQLPNDNRNAYLRWFYTDCNHPELLQKAEAHARIAAQKYATSANLEMHAALLHKNGKNKDALKQVNKALEAVGHEKRDSAPVEKLKVQIQSALNSR